MSQEDARGILAWTRRILDACGPRPAGSEASRKAADLIAEDLRKSCDRVDAQGFECHPWTFIWQNLLLTPAVFAAAVLLYLGYPYASALVGFAVSLLSTLEFGYYREPLDPLFPKGRCRNVLGVIEPKGPAVRQLVISSHHDSAYEFNYLRVSRLLYVLVAGAYVLAVYAMPFVGGLAALLDVAWDRQVPLPLLHGFAFFAGASSLLFLFFVSPRAVPGAGDNLVSCGILVHLGAVLRQRLAANPEALAGTRVILASFDAEESGLRGSRAFVRDNRELLRALPTVNVNLESFYELKELAYLVSDLNGNVPLSKPLTEALARAIADEGLSARPMKMVFGMGGTDAAELARAGIPATTLLAIPSNPLADGKVLYHTRHDLPENLNPTVIDAAARVMLRMIDRVATEPVAQAKAEKRAA